MRHLLSIALLLTSGALFFHEPAEEAPPVLIEKTSETPKPSPRLVESPTPVSDGASVASKTKEVATAGVKHRWHRSYQHAYQEHQAGKPLLLLFTFDGCPPCQRLKRTTLSDPRVAQALSEWSCYEVNSTREPALMRLFPQIRSYPAMILYNPAPQVFRGVVSPEALLRQLEN